MGELYFHDTGGKFNGARHGLTNLIDEGDIYVYSLTTKGDSQPSWLVIKVTEGGCMECYLDENVKEIEQCRVIMEKIDYEKIHPRNLFREVSDLTFTSRYNTKKKIDVAFYERRGFFSEKCNAHDFFSMEVYPESTDPGAKTYLRDKVFFVEGRRD